MTDWDRERRNDERATAIVLILACVLIALGIVFKPRLYPAIGAALQWVGAS